MKSDKLELTRKQQHLLCYLIGEWYLRWKDRITSNHIEHRLGYAVNELKDILFGSDEKEKEENMEINEGWICYRKDIHG